ncbi:MAG TPA: dockerin type I repeat-containing protein [Tepidisphaeraceae bacterium]|nr:dockerin type I repeat-containing protein [Tepidisphaeraceae bacterium]
MRRAELGCLIAGVVGLMGVSARATTTVYVNYGFNDSTAGTGVTTYANAGSLHGSGQMNAPGAVPTNEFSLDGQGVSGQAGDRAMDLTSSGGAGNQALFLPEIPYRSLTYSMWYKLSAPVGSTDESYLAIDMNNNIVTGANAGRLILLDLYGGGNSDGGATLLLQAGGRNIGNLGLDNTEINTAGQWIFLAVVMDQGNVSTSTAGSITVYAGTTNSAATPIFSTPIAAEASSLDTSNLFLGNPSSYNVPLHGLVDDVTFTAADDAGAAFNATQVDALRYSGVFPQSNQWLTNGIGDWNSASNWSKGSAPNGAGAEADFLGALTANHTIVDDSSTPITLGTLHFNNTYTYQIAGTGSLILQGATGNSALIQVDQGTQEINLPLTIASDATLNVAGGATLLLANPVTINSGSTVTQTGDGTVTYQSLVTVQSGASLNFGSSTIGTSLSLQGASSAAIADSGSGNPKTVQFESIGLGAGSKLDLTNNSLVIDYGNTVNSTTPAATIRQYLASGYDHGYWDGSGIISSIASAAAGTTLGYVDTGSQILVEYTWIGDVNLDGVVDNLDVAAMAQIGTADATWSMGDLNYDGIINADDYSLLAYGLAVSDGRSISEVPEPAISGLAALTVMMLGVRRRRR